MICKHTEQAVWINSQWPVIWHALYLNRYTPCIVFNFSCILGDLCYYGFWMFLPFMSLRYVLWAMIHSTSCVADMYIDGLVQERRNSSALAMELRLCCTNPSICYWLTKVTSMKLNAKSDTDLTYNGDLNIVWCTHVCWLRYYCPGILNINKMS